MLSKEYLDTARTILRAAQTMTDEHVAGQLKALAEDYERRAEKAARADAAKALARSAARECEPEWNKRIAKLAWRCSTRRRWLRLSAQLTGRLIRPKHLSSRELS